MNKIYYWYRFKNIQNKFFMMHYAITKKITLVMLKKFLLTEHKIEDTSEPTNERSIGIFRPFLSLQEPRKRTKRIEGIFWMSFMYMFNSLTSLCMSFSLYGSCKLWKHIFWLLLFRLKQTCKKNVNFDINPFNFSKIELKGYCFLIFFLQQI